jgi:hypothetical protein
MTVTAYICNSKYLVRISETVILPVILISFARRFASKFIEHLNFT